MEFFLFASHLRFLNGGLIVQMVAYRFFSWLSEPSQDWATGVTTTMPKIESSFFHWVVLGIPAGGI